VLIPGVGAVVAAAFDHVEGHEPDIPWAWLVFGFMAQATYGARMLVQWLASERARRSTVPPLFWWLSLVGGIAMVVYFIRREDPVGIFGQSFALLVYIRNLWMIYRRRPVATVD
jgi:lipid-A-disaccharide synthase-like uncharacterized protein